MLKQVGPTVGFCSFQLPWPISQAHFLEITIPMSNPLKMLCSFFRQLKFMEWARVMQDWPMHLQLPGGPISQTTLRQLCHLMFNWLLHTMENPATWSGSSKCFMLVILPIFRYQQRWITSWIHFLSLETTRHAWSTQKNQPSWSLLASHPESGKNPPDLAQPVLWKPQHNALANPNHKAATSHRNVGTPSFAREILGNNIGGAGEGQGNIRFAFVNNKMEISTSPQAPKQLQRQDTVLMPPSATHPESGKTPQDLVGPVPWKPQYKNAQWESVTSNTSLPNLAAALTQMPPLQIYWPRNATCCMHPQILHELLYGRRTRAFCRHLTP